jgi:hypothetical protein
MATQTTDGELLAQVRELRGAGYSPKEIARSLGVRPATVAPLVRALAEQSAATEAAEPHVVGCWVSPAWSTGLAIAGHSEWPELDAEDEAHSGVVAVLVARRDRPRRVSVCGYLVDVYCLGVKNALGPRLMKEDDLRSFRRIFFEVFAEAGAPVEAPLDLVRHLVCGAVDYARGLGFEPHPDYAPVAGHLGPWDGPSAITFGRYGVPYYVQGPYDNGASVLRTLARSVGEDNFHFITGLEAAAGM